MQQDATRNGHEQILEELRLFFEVMAGRAESYLRDLSADAGSEQSGHTCGWCPLCAAAALLRGDHPELSGRLLEQLVLITQLVRQLLAERDNAPENGMAPPNTPEAQQPGTASAPSKAQRISVHRVDGRILNPNGSGAESGC